MRRWGPPSLARKGEFNINDKKSVKHTRYGVWDVYEERVSSTSVLPGLAVLEQQAEIVKCMPFVWRMFRDVLALPYCAFLLVVFFAAELGQAFMPAFSLWYQGQLLHIMQIAIDTRTVDKDHLMHICAGRIACTIATHLIKFLRDRIRSSLVWRIRQWSDAHIFRARARLDVPTYQLSSVQRQLDDITTSPYMPPGVWRTIEMLSGFVRAATQATAQVAVLAQTLGGQKDGYMLAGLTMSSQTIQWLSSTGLISGPSRLEARHRRGRASPGKFENASRRVGDSDSAFEQWQIYGRIKDRFSFWALLEYPLRELPQMFFTLRAVQHPASMPVSLASLQMVQESTNTFAFCMLELMHSTRTFAAQIGEVRKLYEVASVPNKVPDGTVPFPEDAAQIRSGVALEFSRNVSFKYPGTENYALRNVSFSILPGQLCVIVGANGSGKSTALKLIVRLHDPDEGQILLDGHDIRTLRLRDLRQAISVLFQDYTHFPLSIRDNIAIGDPSAAGDDEHVRRAARLGGAEAFIEKLPDGLDTYLDRPVKDLYAGLPEGTTTLFGRKVDYGALRDAGGMKATDSSTLSGGQLQRLAVARSFMRSVVPEDARVGLLLFDEPSASLDPVAEHDLFDRLRELRGSKTMLFSSHRFGNLTRHADLILYMNDSVVVEAGTHEELLKQDGGYANIWKLQAQAFL
ncbi:P-loop containing nucleoside triphosphate hydrolase protein [Trametes versicolor FP-101664 SS1]|uniref:P-loop containing nucleoside triphosphate hydrolase protein n=1 Tax=Trametes versicolor (strain FP-101664) TaxID=717944 RepID=UPI00046230BD|nr:P-loop containing nucleoside triphosphate hydrolase protein [Trametes versicolor FP-101664 SS1]EIW65305.1 P-loop containing nucleoside triphosphate hydrolase protein [Trametes versicolor FP-101664 SS1]